MQPHSPLSVTPAKMLLFAAAVSRGDANVKIAALRSTDISCPAFYAPRHLVSSRSRHSSDDAIKCGISAITVHFGGHPSTVRNVFRAVQEVWRLARRRGHR